MGLQTVIQGKLVGPQVKKLVDYLKEHSKPGEIIEHADIENVIGVRRLDPDHKNRNRYATIVQAAKRKHKAENGIEIIAARGVGYRVPNGNEQLAFACNGVKQGVKKIARAAMTAEVISDDRLDEHGRAARDFFMVRAKALVDHARTESRRVTLTCGKPEVLPK